MKTGRLSCLAVLLVCMALLMTPIFAFAAEGDGDPSRDDDVYRVSRDTEIIYGVYHIDDDVELVIASSLIAPRPTTGDDQDTMRDDPEPRNVFGVNYDPNGMRNVAFDGIRTSPMYDNECTFTLIDGWSDAWQTFLGWGLTPDATEYVTSVTATTDNPIVTVYAIWEAKPHTGINYFVHNNFDIVYDYNCDDLRPLNPEDEIYVCGEGAVTYTDTYTFDLSDGFAMHLLDGYVRDGYEFVGWGLTPDAAEPVSSVTATLENSDITVYAVWRRVDMPSEGLCEPPCEPIIPVEDTDTIDEEISLYEPENTSGEDAVCEAVSVCDNLAFDAYSDYISSDEGKACVDGGNMTRGEAISLLYHSLKPEYRDSIFSSESSFTDVSEDCWYGIAVAAMEKAGYVCGYKDGSFGGDRDITRAEFVSFLMRLAPEGRYNSCFVDVAPDFWAYKHISKAAYFGLVGCGEDGRFHPCDTMTGEEAMIIMNRVFGKTDLR